MKRIALAVCIAVIALPVSASAGSSVPRGKFHDAFQKDNQPHRTYFSIKTDKDAEWCVVRLAAKDIIVPMDVSENNNISGTTHLYYTHTFMAARALKQAKATGGDWTDRISCVKES